MWARLTASGLVLWLTVATAASCVGDQAAERSHTALDALTAAVDAGYEATVAACLATERLALARSSTEAAWEATRGEIRGVCDAAVAAFEETREAQTAAREAIDSCRGGVDAPCVARASGAVVAAEQAASRARAAWSRAKPVLDRITSDDRPRVLAPVDGGAGAAP